MALKNYMGISDAFVDRLHPCIISFATKDTIPGIGSYYTPIDRGPARGHEEVAKIVETVFDLDSCHSGGIDLARCSVLS